MIEYAEAMQKDPTLWATLVREGEQEDAYEIDAYDRLTCHTHQEWVTVCTPRHQNTPLY